MNENEILLKIQQLQNDPEFIERARKAESLEAFRTLLASEGIDVSEEKLQSVATGMETDGEISEEALEGVSGGMLIGAFPWLVRWWNGIHGGSAGVAHGAGGGRHG